MMNIEDLKTRAEEFVERSTNGSFSLMFPNLVPLQKELILSLMCEFASEVMVEEFTDLLKKQEGRL